MYDPATMLTQKEYQGSGKVQPQVERPALCILARSGSSVADQALYSTPRVEDLDEIKQGIYFKNLHLQIRPRFVVADYPARAFETGQQIGGNYKCPCGVSSHDHSNLEVSLSVQHQTLQEKTSCVKKGELWKTKNITIFKDLSKSEVVTEAKSRKLYTGTSYQPASKAEVSDQLTDHLKGIQRFPALLIGKKTSMNDVGCEVLEVPECEILHDFVGVFENLMEEIPFHLEGHQREKCQQLFTELRSDKERLKGVDARRCAIRWALFCVREKMPRKITTVAQIMVEVSKIAYSYDEQRTPRQVLRLHNLTFLLATTLVDVVGRVPLKLSQGKFYGIHFHGLTSHLPMVYRIVSLRCLVPEQEEAIFHKLRQVSLNTSSRKPQEVIDNAMVRVPFMYDDLNTRLYRESLISREGSKVPLLPNTTLSKSLVGLKSHLQRISDFLNDEWVSTTGDSLIFFDSQQEPEVRSQGPSLLHFRSSSLKSLEQTLIQNRGAADRYCNLPSAAAALATNRKKEYGESRPNFKRSSLPSFVTGKRKARR